MSFNKETEAYIEHEVKLRHHGELFADIRTTLHRMDDRMDNQFKWIIGILLTFMITVILHLASLI